VITLNVNKLVSKLGRKFDYSKLFHELNGNKALEVGCGDGYQLEIFASQGYECVGLDLVKDSMKNGQKCKRIQMVVGDACCLPFRTNSFDVVFSNEFFSHVTSITIALFEQCRVLRTKGQLLIRDGNIFCPFTLFDLLIMYPIRTKGRYGGLRWLITRNQIKDNVYGTRFTMKDENIKSLAWWKKELRRMEELKLELATTSYTR
jgi:ubiquinone/menaquinone biosynthesis C-methylase UbiE